MHFRQLFPSVRLWAQQSGWGEVSFRREMPTHRSHATTLDVNCFPQNGLVFEYDRANAKLKAFWVDTTVDGKEMLEVANTTDLSAWTDVYLEAFGRFPTS